MLRRFGLFMMLMLAGWIPFQSVAAWQMMAQDALAQEVTMSAPMSMMHDTHQISASCHDTMTTEPNQMTSSSDGHSLSAGTHCAGCLSICTGFPAAAFMSHDVIPLKSVMTPAEPRLYTYVHTPTFERPPQVFIS